MLSRPNRQELGVGYRALGVSVKLWIRGDHTETVLAFCRRHVEAFPKTSV